MNDNAPDRKVVIGAAVGGLVAFAAWLIETFAQDVTLSADAAIGLTTALTFIVQYLVPNRSTPPVTNNQQGGFVRPLMLAMLLAVAVPAVMMLPGCATMGIPTPQTFNERLAAGYVSAKSIRTSATVLLNGSVITSGDAENLQKQADVAREGLDVARALPSLEAEDKLQATLLILQAAQTYLCGKNPNDPNCAR